MKHIDHFQPSHHDELLVAFQALDTGNIMFQVNFLLFQKVDKG